MSSVVRLHIYSQEGKRDTTVGEADAGWRFMGVTGALGCASLLIADKNASGDDKKMLNMAIAGTSAAAAGLFVAHPFCKDNVKPEMRVANLAVNLGVGAFALKAALGK